MTKLPENILVLAMNSNPRHKIILGILKEFFEGLPYILTTLDDGTDCYILPNSELINQILNRIYNKLETSLGIDAFGWDTFIYDHVNPNIWDTYFINPNSWCYDVLPSYVIISEPDDVENLKIFTED